MVPGEENQTRIENAEVPPAINASRLANDAELFKRTEEFIVGLLEAVPELNAVSIVPVWNVPPENIPPALLRFRDPRDVPMTSVLQLLQNMAKFSQSLNRELFTQYQMFEAHHRELSDRIQELSKQVTEMEAEKSATG